ncbi:MAG: exopolysaccharide Pel transporter PelG [Spirochaetes bacterium]|nr:exopolysaccharide Pel transporter PelG [Spirochaetota bacterium]
MAGIGFELQRVLKKGGIGSFFKVVLAGSMVVAGPWILTILGIFFIGKFAENELAQYHKLFTAAIVYSYAFSLIFFGGSHYIFTRYVADLIYEDKNQDAGSALVSFSLIVAVIALIIGIIAVVKLKISYMPYYFLYKVSVIILFILINLTWLLMIFISLLKRFMAIFMLYLIGMVLSFAAVKLLGHNYYTGGALLGYTLGQLFIVVSLFLLVFKEYKPGRLIFRDFISYIVRFKYLLLSGILYYWGMWVDKVVFRAILGTEIPGTFFKLFDYYDIPVYIANLTIIPGMIYYVIVTEIDFYIHLKEFLRGLNNDMYSYMQAKKYAMVNSIKNGLREQGLFQGILTFAFILLSGEISRLLFHGLLSVSTLRIVLGGVFFHFMLLTLLIYLFYLELYRYAFFSSIMFFGVNLLLSLLIAFTKSYNLLGVSYLLGGLAASVFAAVLLLRSARYADRDLYARQSA